MPFVRIDTLAGQYDVEQRALISGVLFDAVKTIGAKAGDKFQAFHDHAPGDLVFDAEYLGIAHTDGFIVIQMTLVQGRSIEQKEGLFAFIAEQLHKRVGIRPGDVFINLIEIAKENWSFGDGKAQYAPHK
jgi:4-oxalocrotonate tautomerase